MAKLTMRFLKALNGDCIFISLMDDAGIQRNILIDGGPSETYVTTKNSKSKPEDGELKHLVAELREGGHKIDLLILTHIDDDHIDGILTWFNKDADSDTIIDEIWFNGGQPIADYLKSKTNPDLEPCLHPKKDLNTSVAQAISFTTHIADKGIWDGSLYIQGNSIERYGLKFYFLSPDVKKLEQLILLWKKKKPGTLTAGRLNDYAKSLADHIKDDKFEEDDSPTNGSAIAFILQVKEKNFLLLADSHPSIIVAGLKNLGYSPENPLVAELIKLSHHGSAGNTSTELLTYLDSSSYIISTNGRIHQHPDKQMLARLINTKKDITIYSNYPERLKLVFSAADKKEYSQFIIADLEKPLQFNL